MTRVPTDPRPDPYFVRIRFNDPDELAMKVRAWDLDFHQLDRGEFEGEVHQVGDMGTQVGRARFSRQIDQCGSTPAGLRTFGISAAPSQPLNWFGRPVMAEDMLVFPTSRELRSVSSPGFDMFTLSVSEQRIEEAARDLGVHVPIGVAGPTVLRPDASALNRLRQRLQAALEGSQKTAELLADVIPRELVTAWSMSDEDGRSPRAMRLHAAELARQAIDLHMPGNITIVDLARKMGVSERTLQAGFREAFQISPKQYLQGRRLSGVRHDLLRSRDGRRKIVEIANEWGYWHMGQFAADYRRMFGELPSETIAGTSDVPAQLERWSLASNVPPILRSMDGRDSLD